MNWIDRLERKYKRFAIKGLIKYLIIGYAIVGVLGSLRPTRVIVDKLMLYIPDVLHGQVWRLVTFIFVPPTFNVLFLIFALYMFYIFGSALEEYWGSFRLNLYYFIGVLAAILAACITQNGHAEHLTLSIFLAFAYLNPNYKILLFFIIPVKVKYLALIDVVFILYSLVFDEMSLKIAALLSLVNFLLFFGMDMYGRWIRPGIKKLVKKHRRNKFKVIVPQHKFEFVHKCKECGKTSKRYPELKFGYCPTCGSDFEYCQDHLKNHKHIIYKD